MWGTLDPQLQPLHFADLLVATASATYNCPLNLYEVYEEYPGRIGRSVSLFSCKNALRRNDSIEAIQVSWYYYSVRNYAWGKAGTNGAEQGDQVIFGQS